MTAVERPDDSSALYVGSVMHRRLRPKPHRLRMRAFWLNLDLDGLDALDGRLRLFSRNRFNAVSFRDRDHGDTSAVPLRTQAEGHLRAAGIEPDGGPIRLFCMPRIFGFAFNPLSIYFCHRRDGAMTAILYEVRNTFRQRHTYVIPVTAGSGPVIEQSCAKRFYVSPFMNLNMNYDFRVTPPAATASVSIRVSEGGQPTLLAVMSGRKVPLTDAALLRLLISIPLMTLRVIAAIHWHAVVLWWKGISLTRRPPAPASSVTVVESRLDGLAQQSPQS